MRPPSRSAPGLLSGSGSRGLTGAGGAATVLGAGCLGGAVDLVAGTDLGPAFVVLFVLGCVVAAARVRPRDLLWAVVAPPLLFVVLALLAGLARTGGSTSNFLMRQVLEAGAAVVTSAPALVGGTGVAAAIAVSRRRALQRRSVR